jgi:hypothetical protein
VTWSYTWKTQKIPRHHKQLQQLAGYKFNLQKSVAFLYTNNEQIEEEYRKKNSIYNSLRKIKYLGINFKDVKGLYKENYKLLKNEIKDCRRWKNLLWSLAGRINLLKMAVLTKVICMFNAIPIKIPVTFITEVEKSTLIRFNTI